MGPKPNVKRFPVKSVDQEPLKFPDKRNALIEKKLSSKKFPRKHVTWNHKDNASTSLNWYLFLNLSKSALISPRRSAPAPVLTQEKFKSLLSRNGAMFQLLNLVLLKHFTGSKCSLSTIMLTICLSTFSFRSLRMSQKKA